jgi:hypothetical protein
MSRRPLPPLEVGTAYEAADFERFEYCAPRLSEGAPTLRLHLKNGTTLDLPASDADLRLLALHLCEAYPGAVIDLLKSRGWV